MLYPPFCDIIVVGFTSLIDKECNVAALKFRDMLEKRSGSGVHGYSAAGAGPARYVISKVNGRFRWRLILKCRNSPRLRELMELTLKEAALTRRSGELHFSRT